MPRGSYCFSDTKILRLLRFRPGCAAVLPKNIALIFAAAVSISPLSLNRRRLILALILQNAGQLYKTCISAFKIRPSAVTLSWLLFYPERGENLIFEWNETSCNRNLPFQIEKITKKYPEKYFRKVKETKFSLAKNAHFVYDR